MYKCSFNWIFVLKLLAQTKISRIFVPDFESEPKSIVKQNEKWDGEFAGLRKDIVLLNV